MLSWQRGNQRGLCDGGEGVKARREGTIVAITNGPSNAPANHRGSINGLHLNDKTISHQQPIPLSLGQAQLVCTSWGKRFHRRHMEFGFGNAFNHDRMRNHQMSSSQSLLQLAAQRCHRRWAEQNGKLTKRHALSDT